MTTEPVDEKEGLPMKKDLMGNKPYKGLSGIPVHEHEGVWWFWDEAWSNRIGSYIDKVGAEKGFQDYIEELNLVKPVNLDFEINETIQDDEYNDEFDVNQCNCAYMVAGAQCAYCREYNDS